MTKDMDKFLDSFTKIQTEEQGADTNKKIRVGIIGTGGIANGHAAGYLEIPGVEIVAGADLIPGKAEAFFKKHGIKGAKCYNSHKEMLDDEDLRLDAVSVCTYNMTHAQCTVYALEKGVNVLLEKPMCVTMDEAVEIMKAERKSGKIVSVGFQPRFDPNMQMVKNIVQSGILGDIYYIQTGGGRRRGIPASTHTTFIEKETAGIGAIGDIGCYSLDMVLNAVGYPKPLTVTGYKSDFFGKNPDYSGYVKAGHREYAERFGVDDFAAGFIRLEGGIVVDFRISWAMNMDTSGDTLILGTKAGLKIPSTECWNGSIGGDLVVFTENAGEQVQIVYPKKESDVHCFDLKIRSFVDAVRENKKAPVPTSEIIINQAIISGLCESAEKGEEIKIQIPEI